MRIYDKAGITQSYDATYTLESIFLVGGSLSACLREREPGEWTGTARKGACGACACS